MKKTKLKLEDLKVQSFVTSLEKQQKQTIDGGVVTLLCPSVTFIISASINITSQIANTTLDWALDTGVCELPAPAVNNSHMCIPINPLA